MVINEIINVLNEYVENDNDIYQIDEIKLMNENIEKYSPNVVIEIINELEFEYYTNDQTRIGKDNYFWSEIDVLNLPKNSYLKNLLIETIKEIDIIERAKIDGNNLLLIYESSYAYCKSSGRIKEKENLKMTNSIKDNLKIKMGIKYNNLEHLFDRLKK